VLKNGRIVLQWARYHNSGGKGSGDNHAHNLAKLAEGLSETDAYRIPEYCVSEDDGNTFGPPIEIPHEAVTNYTALVRIVMVALAQPSSDILTLHSLTTLALLALTLCVSVPLCHICVMHGTCNE
jgi:hypothetical protein